MAHETSLALATVVYVAAATAAACTLGVIALIFTILSTRTVRLQRCCCCGCLRRRHRAATARERPHTPLAAGGSVIMEDAQAEQFLLSTTAIGTRADDDDELEYDDLVYDYNAENDGNGGGGGGRILRGLLTDQRGL